MSRYAFVSLLALGLFAPPLVAQDPPARAPAVEPLPRAVSREVVRLYDEPHALRAFDRAEVGAAQVVAGNVSVIDGPLVIAGHVTGRVLAINADVILRPGARVDGDLLVVGGDVEGDRTADVGGEIRVYRPPLRYSRQGERIVILESDREVEDESWWRRWERRRTTRPRARFVVGSAGTYNRVEGLPIHAGPVLELRPRWGSVRGELFAVARTGSSFRGDSNDLGHDLELAVRHGRTAGVRLGGRLFDVNVPVESWQLSRLEYGLAAFLLRRDYQDFYGRHGGSVHVGVFDRQLGDLELSYGHERWRARASHDPFSLFRTGADWRANPLMDAGRMHLVRVAGRLDTRNDDDRPWAGWYVQADAERGTGDLEQLGPTPPGLRRQVEGRAAYTRGFLDARRYNRVGPAAQLNFRLVAGGRLAGELPLQRRLSVSGAGALPGFDFRTPIADDDVGTCSSVAAGVAPIVPGRPALCDRIVLAQAEYRGDLFFDPFGAFDRADRTRHFRSDATWVVFADAGRGWLVGEPQGGLRYDSGTLPPPSTFRADVGAGIDLGSFGIFAAKALSDGGEPLNFLIRLRHRF